MAIGGYSPACRAATIKESEQTVVLLNPKDQQLETAYLDYVKGGLAFLQKDNVTAQNHFNKALPAIQQNGDFTNEHVIYLYLGKILWQQNQKAAAVGYFRKIDALFHEKEFLNYELREAYDYLIAFYQETNESALQFQAAESLMALNMQFEREQKSITTALHQGLDKKKLKDSQVHLQKSLQKSKIWIGALGAILCLVAVLLFWRRKKKSKTTEQKTIDNIIADEKTNDAIEQVKTVANLSDENPSKQKVTERQAATMPDKPLNNQRSAVLSPTEQRLMEGLQRFEEEKGFLGSVSLEDLAKILHTNRSTLSPFLNDYKNGFNSYINTLRIQQVIADLKSDKALRNKPAKDLVANYGSLHPKTFSQFFKAETGKTLSAFIKDLDNESA